MDIQDAKDILSALPDTPNEAFPLPNGARLMLKGIRSFAVLREIAQQVELWKANPKNRFTEEVLWTLEVFQRGVFEPKFTRTQAIEFSEKAGPLFAEVVKRVQALSVGGLEADVEAAKAEVLGDPT